MTLRDLDRHCAGCQKLIEQVGGADKIAAIGICNQRENGGSPGKRPANRFARRLSGRIAGPANMRPGLESRKRNLEGPWSRRNTSLLRDPYFPAGKSAGGCWKLGQRSARRETIWAFGTIESYLIFRLTGGQHVPTPAMPARRCCWRLMQ